MAGKSNIIIRDFVGTDYPELPIITNEIFKEMVAVVEDYTVQDEMRPSHCKQRRWIAEFDNQIVGTATYNQYSNMYDPKQFFLWFIVRPNFQRRGIGTLLYKTVLESLEQFSPENFQAWVQSTQDETIKWLQRRDFIEHERDGESHLDVASCDLIPYNKLEQTLASDGIQIKTLAELSSDNNRDRKIYDLDWETARDQPDMKNYTRVSFEEFLKDGINYAQRPHDAFMVALDGDKYVGLCQFVIERGENSLLQGLTGVIKQYRGRRIAQALKVKAIQWAKDNNYTKIKTGNHVENSPMLAINDKLGFIRQPDWLIMQRLLKP